MAQVPYSLHCSYPELRSFVAALRPRSLVCTVGTRIEPDVCTDASERFANLLAPSWAPGDPGAKPKRYALRPGAHRRRPSAALYTIACAAGAMMPVWQRAWLPCCSVTC